MVLKKHHTELLEFFLMSCRKICVNCRAILGSSLGEIASNLLDNKKVFNRSNMQKMHIANVLREGKLYKKATAAHFATVTVSTLLVAESDPDQKETLIKLIMNMLSLET